MHSPVVLRTPSIADVDLMARLHVLTWQQAYRGIFSDAFLAALDPKDREPMWQRITTLIAGGDSLPRAVVAERGDEPVGFALVSRNLEDDRASGELSLNAIYALSSEHGTGLGVRLLDAVLAPAEAANLWVAADNARAIAFYQKHRFAADGTERIDEGGCDGVRVIRMVRPAL